MNSNALDSSHTPDNVRPLDTPQPGNGQSNPPPSGRRSRSVAILFGAFWIAVIVLSALLIFIQPGHRAVGPGALIEKLEALAALRSDMLKSAEAEKRAVMADTDEASVAYAEESRQASDAAEAERRQLMELIRQHPSDEETQLLGEFSSAWEQVRSIDRQLLELAVQNTNLKAQALSFGKATELLHRFEAAIEGATQGQDDPRVLRSASDALTAMLTIQVLHAPHIASRHDEEMSQMEQTMREKEEIIRSSLDRLADLLPGRRDQLAAAVAAYRDYMAVTRTILNLSRQNTNVTSLELSINRKLKMTTQCEVLLDRLQEAIRAREFKATR